jgi:hypothetical protein
MTQFIIGLLMLFSVSGSFDDATDDQLPMLWGFASIGIVLMGTSSVIDRKNK